jgi:arylsulfatase
LPQPKTESVEARDASCGGACLFAQRFGFNLVDDIKRDPFEQAVGLSQKTAMSVGGALGGPVTALLYDWNLLPIGQQLWLDWFETLKAFPPLQAPESYNPTQVMDQLKSPTGGHPSD